MNLNYLKTFYYSAKLGSLTNAAAFLDITQPAATRQLQELQGNLELVLFDKTGKKMVLTDVGYILYNIAEKIMELDKEIDKNIKDYQNQKSGNIKIITTEGFGNYYLPEMIVLFKKMYPDVVITIDIDTPSNIPDEISRMKYDIGFTDNPSAGNDTVLTKILDDYFFLVTNSGNELSELIYFTADDLSSLNLVTMGKGSIERVLIDEYLLQNEITVNIVCEVSSYHSLKNYVKNNIGVAIAPKHVLNDEITSGNLVAVPERDKSIKNNYYLINHKDKFFNKPLHMFREIVLKWSNFYSKGLLDNSKWDNILL
ncbi:MAG: LysR family transcriptional regulator [Spirochaetia bacterium]|jgi:DNA-binding transcriptional LysR family regulator|nr:LysR family transcriptional regulator [Spirochaetia bacterium]